MVATAHPLATTAGLRMLAQGGTAVDAVIAAQLVLGLVEPQSSGLGGGLLMLHWDAAARRLTAIDGLAAAPGRTTASLRTDVDGRLLPSEPSQRGGRSVGVPGALPALVLAHERHGRLPWRQLVEPARQAAQEGFAMPPYLHAVLAPTTGAAELRAAFGLYFDAEGRPMPVGTLIRHPAYANTMRVIGDKGPEAWLAQRGTSGLLEAAQQGFRPSLMTAEDIQAYRAVAREPLCAPFRAYRVCTTPPPSFGGIAVLQILQTVQAVKSIGPLDFNDPGFLHLFAEAGKLAQADRRLHVGDPDHVRVPAQDLVAEPYVRERAQQIDPARAMPEPAAGRPTGLASTTAPGPVHPADRALMAGAGRCPDGGCTSGPVFVPAQVVPDDGPTFGQTSQIAVADRHGNVVSVTTTNNLNFGARLAFGGVVLNNAMTNFSAAPKPGQVLANQMAPAKRPVTSMAPTIAFDAHGRPVLAGGSAGGGPIVDYVAASLMDMLANGRTPDQAVARAHITTATPSVLQLERGRGMEALAAQLQAQGHAVEMVSLPSGQVYIRRVDNGWVGAADPRRDGVASSR
jgi:gamma-glutamyltranspeptidase/glutathione hydrolase